MHWLYFIVQTMIIFCIKKELDKCSHSYDSLVCPCLILTLVNDTKWLGLPWHPNSELVFSHHQQRAIDCTSFSDFFHLGGRYCFLQSQNLTFHNRTDKSLQISPLTPLTVYHFPCNLVFATQPIGLGACPSWLSLHLPIFTQTQFHYIPWGNSHGNCWSHLLTTRWQVHYTNEHLTMPNFSSSSSY